MKKAFIFGVGYTGVRLRDELLLQGWEVVGTQRTKENKAMAQNNYSSVYLVEKDGATVKSLAEASNDLRGVTHFVTTAQPTVEGDPAFMLYAEALKSLDTLVWVGYMSTTGVYGNHDGRTVTEETPPSPLTRRGKRRQAAEEAWQGTKLPIHIFRLPGIYGPGRGPLAKVRAGRGTMVDKPGHRFNRCHVKDIVSIVISSMNNPLLEGRVYNVVDDLPEESAVVNEFAFRLLGRTPPPRVPWQEAAETMSAMARSFYGDNKVCSNKRIKEELGVVLYYPTYKEGLPSVLEEENAEWWKYATSWSGLKSGLFSGLSYIASLIAVPFVLTAGVVSGLRRWAFPLPPAVILLDNGSLRPSSTENLRSVAQNLSQHIHVPVHAVSMLHSNKVDSKALGGKAAWTLSPFLRHMLQTGQANDFIVIPFFFGPSGTLTRSLPQAVREILPEYPYAKASVAPCLVHPTSQPNEDNRIARILCDNVRQTMRKNEISNPRVVIVDHGTPTNLVNKARRVVAQQVRGLLAEDVLDVTEACMERREGEQYDFNGTLLEQALPKMALEEGSVDVVVALLFLSPGRHAGEGGDICKILDECRESTPSVRTYTTPLMGHNPLLLEVLSDRYHTALSSATPVGPLPKQAASPRCPVKL